MNKATKLSWSAVLFAILALNSTTSFAEIVEVRLLDGRTITGAIHQRTDEKQLWLQYGTRAVTVIRPIDWQRIQHASHTGKPITVPQLQTLASNATSATALTTVGQRTVRVPPAEPRVQGDTMASRARQALGFSRRVRSVQFDVILANWDGDVETDGLLLRLFPLDEQGDIVAARGTLQVEFVAGRQQDLNRGPRHGGATSDRIGRWTRQVDEADFRQGVATIKLPFQAIHPEFDTSWFSDGLVHVRLTVPGNGTFDASLDGVRVRPFAPLRDAMQRRSGQRFLPSERTGRGRPSAG